jgi:hypothetical protein
MTTLIVLAFFFLLVCTRTGRRFLLAVCIIAGLTYIVTSHDAETGPRATTTAPAPPTTAEAAARACSAQTVRTTIGG